MTTRAEKREAKALERVERKRDAYRLGTSKEYVSAYTKTEEKACKSAIARETRAEKGWDRPGRKYGRTYGNGEDYSHLNKGRKRKEKDDYSNFSSSPNLDLYDDYDDDYDDCSDSSSSSSNPNYDDYSNSSTPFELNFIKSVGKIVFWIMWLLWGLILWIIWLGILIFYIFCEIIIGIIRIAGWILKSIISIFTKIIEWIMKKSNFDSPNFSKMKKKVINIKTYIEDLERDKRNDDYGF